MAEATIDHDQTVLGRSELERYTVCPRQAVMIESGKVNANSFLATIGDVAHDA